MKKSAVWLLIISAFFSVSCSSINSSIKQSEGFLSVIASSKEPWSSVAVSRNGRIFAAHASQGQNSKDGQLVEITPEGKSTPFPDKLWNSSDTAPLMLPIEHFINITSLAIDQADFLWVLDNGFIDGNNSEHPDAKLVRIEINSGRIAQVISIPENVLYRESTLHDLQIDMPGGIAYIADSGRAAIILLDIVTGESRRLLDNHPSLLSEGEIISSNGNAIRNKDGSIIKGDISTIDLSPDGDYLYYQALSAKTLYRIRTSTLRDLSNPEPASAVEIIGRTFLSDVLRFGSDGVIYGIDIQRNAFMMIDQKMKLQEVIRDSRLSWIRGLSLAKENSFIMAAALPTLYSNFSEYPILKLTIR